MTAHLRGRQDALERLGWTGPAAEWIALACLHSGGVFTRAQLSAHLRIDAREARRFVRALSERRFVVEETRGGRKVCRIMKSRVYRLLGAEETRHFRGRSPDVLMRRLLSLDYVLERPHASWLPTERDKVGALEALGIERRLLPFRVYQGRAGGARHYFPVKLPVALEADRAVFVHVGSEWRNAHRVLRHWAAGHLGLWKALRERGRMVDVVAIDRTPGKLQQAGRTLVNWTGDREPSAGRRPRRAGNALVEIARIERAIRERDARVIGEYGDLQAGLRRLVELRKLSRKRAPRPVIDSFAVWRSTRVPRTGY